MAKIFLSAFFILSTWVLVCAQEEATIPFQVNVNYTPLSISQEQLLNAKTLSDLNRMFKPEWVKEYLWVEISSINDGKLISIKGENNILKQKHKDFLKRIDLPAPITVRVHYIPDNTLSYNEAREESFTFSVFPPKSAEFKKGKQELEKYLKEEAIEKIPNGLLKEYDLAVVKFTINEQGQVVDTSIFQSTKDDQIDNHLYNVICDMPDWIPAEYDNGIKVRQEFALTIGNHESCVINLINTVNKLY